MTLADGDALRSRAEALRGLSSECTAPARVRAPVATTEDVLAAHHAAPRLARAAVRRCQTLPRT